MIVVLVAALALPTMSQSYEAQKQQQVAAPAAGFRSTSVLQGSGSTYSSNPSLNTDGTASYNGAAASPAKAPGGPHRAVDPISGLPEMKWYEDQGITGAEMPLGDALIPLALMALAFGAVVYYRRKRADVG